ncbi:RHS repeat domain-containing protein [Methyloversatilis sp.]|uniref:RHS repeat domain-containing protein n=1 Tax=Methyloversatilis sp. TaxID=2569862 RepID=UPI0035AF506E
MTLDGAAVTLDAAGQITNDGLNSYTWDDAGRLKTVSRGGQLRATYHYDHKHRRTRKVMTAAAPQGAQTVLYSYDEPDRLVSEVSGEGSPLRGYVWSDENLIGQVEYVANATNTGYEIGRIVYYELDHLGTPRQARERTGTVVWRWESDGYGTTPADEDPDGNGQKTYVYLRFPGQYYDEESGLHYNWHRYYVPRLGRYLSSDPIGVEGGGNAYAYVGGNPLGFVDPTGLQAQGLSALCGPYFWACAGAATIATAIGVKGTVDSISKSSSIPEVCPPKECPPCKTVSGRIVPVETIAYRPLDVIPDDRMQHGVYGSHHNIFVAKQNPNNCQCFWQKQKYVAKPGELPVGSIPIEPLSN